MTSPRIEQVNVDDDRFDLFVDGERAFICEREHVVVRGRPQRGYWLLKMVTPLGPLIVERDQYSNDIRERVQIHVEEKKIYGNRFRIPCDASSYATNMLSWLSDISSMFPGEWSGYYDEHNGWAVLDKD
jgi:hypothetical protein